MTSEKVEDLVIARNAAKKQWFDKLTMTSSSVTLSLSKGAFIIPSAHASHATME
jgi:hypothetical protein